MVSGRDAGDVSEREWRPDSRVGRVGPDQRSGAEGKDRQHALQCGERERPGPPSPLWRGQLHLGSGFETPAIRFQWRAPALLAQERAWYLRCGEGHGQRGRPEVCAGRQRRDLRARSQSVSAAATLYAAGDAAHYLAGAINFERRGGLALPRRVGCAQQLFLVAGLEEYRVPAV